MMRIKKTKHKVCIFFQLNSLFGKPRLHDHSSNRRIIWEILNNEFKVRYILEQLLNLFKIHLY